MDVLNYLVELIKEVGFPIACCVVLFIQNNKLTNTLMEIKKSMEELSGRMDGIDARLNKRRTNDGKKEK